MLEALIKQHGEKHRRLIEDAVPYLQNLSQRAGVDLDIPQVINGLVEKAIYHDEPTISQNTKAPD